MHKIHRTDGLLQTLRTRPHTTGSAPTRPRPVRTAPISQPPQYDTVRPRNNRERIERAEISLPESPQELSHSSARLRRNELHRPSRGRRATRSRMRKRIARLNNQAFPFGNGFWNGFDSGPSHYDRLALSPHSTWGFRRQSSGHALHWPTYPLIARSGTSAALSPFTNSSPSHRPHHFASPVRQRKNNGERRISSALTQDGQFPIKTCTRRLCGPAKTEDNRPRDLLFCSSVLDITLAIPVYSSL